MLKKEIHFVLKQEIFLFFSRFSLATERLKALLDPLLCSETPNIMHMQNYLYYNKTSNENKEQPSAKILSTYQV